MKTLPIIRHIRWLYLSWQVEKHYSIWSDLGMLSVNRHLDEEQINRVWRGEA